jgi:hypothetical protein
MFVLVFIAGRRSIERAITAEGSAEKEEEKHIPHPLARARDDKPKNGFKFLISSKSRSPAPPQGRRGG